MSFCRRCTVNFNRKYFFMDGTREHIHNGRWTRADDGNETTKLWNRIWVCVCVCMWKMAKPIQKLLFHFTKVDIEFLVYFFYEISYECGVDYIANICVLYIYICGFLYCCQIMALYCGVLYIIHQFECSRQNRWIVVHLQYQPIKYFIYISKCCSMLNICGSYSPIHNCIKLAIDTIRDEHFHRNIWLIYILKIQCDIRSYVTLSPFRYPLKIILNSSTKKNKIYILHCI